MCVWSLNGFTFLEHFVINEKFRNKGYGGILNYNPNCFASFFASMY